MPTEEGDKRTGSSASEVISEANRIEEYKEIKSKFGKDHNEMLKEMERVKKAYENDPTKTTDEELKDPEALNRRGLESTFDYERRRQMGLPPKNEKDDPNSRHSLKAIEETLLLDNANNGVEFSAVYDKDGELISIYKGEKGVVATYIPLFADDGATMTHTHPTDGTDRVLGHTFSDGDIKVFGRGLAEIRAVAREGTYSLKGTPRIPADLLEKLKVSPDDKTRELANKYEKAYRWEKHDIACAVLKNEVEAMWSHCQQYGDRATNFNGKGAFFNSPKFSALAAATQARMYERYGLQYEFKANAGFEDMEKAIKASSGVNQTGFYRDQPSSRRANELIAVAKAMKGFDLKDDVTQPMAKPSTSVPRAYTRDGEYIPAKQSKPAPATAPAIATVGGSPATATGGDGKRKRVAKPKEAPTPPKTPKTTTDIKPSKPPRVTIKQKPTVTLVGGKPTIIPVTESNGGYSVNSGFTSGGGSFLTGGGFNFTK